MTRGLQGQSPKAASADLCGDFRFCCSGSRVGCIPYPEQATRLPLQESYRVTPGIVFPPLSMTTLLSSITKLLMSYSVAYSSA